jgi:hypothetical protein
MDRFQGACPDAPTAAQLLPDPQGEQATGPGPEQELRRLEGVTFCKARSRKGQLALRSQLGPRPKKSTGSPLWLNRDRFLRLDSESRGPALTIDLAGGSGLGPNRSNGERLVMNGVFKDHRAVLGEF